MKKIILTITALFLLCAMVQAETIDLYETNFENGFTNTFINDGISDSWNSNKTKFVREENELSTFLRGWRNGKTSLKLTGLDNLLGASTRNINLTFDFYAIDSWDGDHLIWGKDRFHIKGDLNKKWFVKRQELFPLSSLPGYFSYDFKDRITSVGKNLTGSSHWHDTIYKNVSINFLHEGNDLDLTFLATGLQGKRDESWGIDNIKITSNTTSPSAAPEPTTMLLVGIGLISLAGVARKKE